MSGSAPPGRAPAGETLPARRTGRRAAAGLVFLALLAGLAAIAALDRFFPPRPVTGLPQDPDALAARDLLYGRVAPGGERLRFESALTGPAPALAPPAREQRARADRAAALLARARARHSRDPRLLAALGHAALARRRLDEAERHYRAALDRAPRYGEARLGLGVLLAERAELEQDLLRARALRLRALAQFAAVSSTETVYEPALYDRALMLARVGRSDEALGRARAYLARDSTGAWAGRLRRALGLARR